MDYGQNSATIAALESLQDIATKKYSYDEVYGSIFFCNNIIDPSKKYSPTFFNSLLKKKSSYLEPTSTLCVQQGSQGIYGFPLFHEEDFEYDFYHIFNEADIDMKQLPDIRTLLRAYRFPDIEVIFNGNDFPQLISSLSTFTQYGHRMNSFTLQCMKKGELSDIMDYQAHGGKFTGKLPKGEERIAFIPLDTLLLSENDVHTA